MSAEASGWVWRHSPWAGDVLIVHLAIADSVNDQHGNEFWMSVTRLAEKARCTRPWASQVIAQLVRTGYLEVLEEPKPGGPKGTQPARYRFLFPDVGPNYDSRQTTVKPVNSGGGGTVHSVDGGTVHSVEKHRSLSKHNPKEATQGEDGSQKDLLEVADANPAVRNLSLLNLWNRHAAEAGLPRAISLTGARMKQAKMRLMEHTLLEHDQAMRKICASAFCRGMNDRGWKANFDFYLRPGTWTKAMEGAYDNRRRVSDREAATMQAAHDFLNGGDR